MQVMAEKMPLVAQMVAIRKRRGKVLALNGLDLRLHAGKVLALLGRNGAGKSTAVDILLGLLNADAGEVSCFGAPAGGLAQRQRTGVMLQAAALPAASTVQELLEATCACYPQPLPLAECLQQAGLEGLEKRRYGNLSGGQQRRVQFALAICGRPQLLFLDEPTTGLDSEARQALWQVIIRLRAQGTAVLLTTHYLEEAEALADTVAVIEQGRILAEGPVEAIRAHVRRQYIRCRSALDAGSVAGWPGVLEARREEQWLHLVVPDAVAILPRLLAADTALADIEISRAGLAEAVMTLSQSTPPKENCA